MRNTVDLTTPNTTGEYAIFLPALSTFYLKQLSKIDNDPNFHGVNRLGPSFDKGHTGLNFLDENGYYHYKWALYSAGHARLDVKQGANEERMVHKRDRKNTVIIGDSGGFQVTKGTSHFKNIDWNTFDGPGGDGIRQKVLTWLEETADWSMTLDIPAVAILENPNIKTFEDTLRLSVVNLDYFIKHRIPGKTKFLNVLSGSNVENSKVWYDEVIKYNNPREIEKMGYDSDRTLEGYAFAGINKMHMRTVLERMLDLIRDGMLEGKDWIHFLGIGRLDWACYLTSIQRCLREHYNPNVTISFDAASAFVAVAKGLTYSHNIFTPKRWGYNMESAIDERLLKGSNLPFPFLSPITERMTIGDICRLGPGEANKQGKVSKTSWDNMSYLLLMAHNVYNHISAVQEANRLVDYELSKSVIQKVSYKDWTKTKKSCVSNEVSNYVPANIIFFNSFVEELLHPNNPDPYEMLYSNSSFLESISFGAKDDSVLRNMFDDVTDNPEEDFVSLDDNDMETLENEE